MNIPEVGQKYKCVAHGWVDVYPNDILEVIGIDLHDNGDCFCYLNHKDSTITWSVDYYPNDFKLVEENNIDQAIKYMYTSPSKPPLGLQSWNVHDNLRVQDILAAMQRYVAANKAVPNEWLEELIDKIELDYTQEGIYHE